MSVAIFDLDNTLIQGQSQFYLLVFLYKKKIISLVDFLIIVAWFIFYRLGLVADPKRIMEIAFKFASNKSEAEIGRLLEDFYEKKIADKYYAPSLKKVSYHRGKNDIIIVLSNSIEPLVKVVANHLGIDCVIATKLESINGYYTGKISGEPVYGQNKVAVLVNLKTDFANSYIYADHYSDLPLLKMASHPTVVNPDNKLLAFAKNKNWEII